VSADTYIWTLVDAQSCNTSLYAIVVPAEDVLGCLCSDALNYSSLATLPDGSCAYPSCGELDHEGQTGAVVPSSIQGFLGEGIERELSFFAGTLLQDPTSGVDYTIESLAVDSVIGLPEGLQLDIDNAVINAGGLSCLALTGNATSTGTFEVQIWATASVDVFGTSVSVGAFSYAFTIDILANPNPIEGCTYSQAANYNPIANVEDGSCAFPGCTDAEAINFDAFATDDGGGCIYTETLLSEDCVMDFDDSGFVGSGDLIIFLTFYEFYCD